MYAFLHQFPNFLFSYIYDFKWINLREEYRIPRRERTAPVPTQHDISRYVRVSFYSFSFF